MLQVLQDSVFNLLGYMADPDYESKNCVAHFKSDDAILLQLKTECKIKITFKGPHNPILYSKNSPY